MTANFTRKLAALAMGLTIAAGAVGTAGRASAAGLTPAEAAALAGFGGFVVGTMVGQAQHRHAHRVVVVEDSWDNHVARCYARYRTYDEVSDTFIGRDGFEHRCRL